MLFSDSKNTSFITSINIASCVCNKFMIGMTTPKYSQAAHQQAVQRGIFATMKQWLMLRVNPYVLWSFVKIVSTVPWKNALSLMHILLYNFVLQ